MNHVAAKRDISAWNFKLINEMIARVSFRFCEI
jgi:hypothetical protein